MTLDLCCSKQLMMLLTGTARGVPPRTFEARVDPSRLLAFISFIRRQNVRRASFRLTFRVTGKTAMSAIEQLWHYRAYSKLVGRVIGISMEDLRSSLVYRNVF